MAIVVDEVWRHLGLVTMEDLLEEIVGNIYDEFDPRIRNHRSAQPVAHLRFGGTGTWPRPWRWSSPRTRSPTPGQAECLISSPCPEDGSRWKWIPGLHIQRWRALWTAGWTGPW